LCPDSGRTSRTLGADAPADHKSAAARYVPALRATQPALTLLAALSFAAFPALWPLNRFALIALGALNRVALRADYRFPLHPDLAAQSTGAANRFTLGAFVAFVSLD